MDLCKANFLMLKVTYRILIFYLYFILFIVFKLFLRLKMNYFIINFYFYPEIVLLITLIIVNKVILLSFYPKHN